VSGESREVFKSAFPWTKSKFSEHESHSQGVELPRTILIVCICSCRTLFRGLQGRFVTKVTGSETLTYCRVDCKFARKKNIKKIKKLCRLRA
jgi:hypothetical protein